MYIYLYIYIYVYIYVLKLIQDELNSGTILIPKQVQP